MSSNTYEKISNFRSIDKMWPLLRRLSGRRNAQLLITSMSLSDWSAHVVDDNQPRLTYMHRYRWFTIRNLADRETHHYWSATRQSFWNDSPEASAFSYSGRRLRATSRTWQSSILWRDFDWSLDDRHFRLRFNCWGGGFWPGLLITCWVLRVLLTCS